MTGFLYYVPGRKRPSDDDLVALGLDAVLSRPIIAEVPQNGLDGGTGHTLADRSLDVAIVRILRDHQTWRAGPNGADGKPKFWIGYYNDQPPTPDDLKRPESGQLPGPLLDLEQHRWMVPRLREWRDSSDGPTFSSGVPRLLDYDENGKPARGNIVPRYRELWDESCRVSGLLCDQLLGTGSASLGGDALLNFACRCLSTNYRVTLIELSVMNCASEADAAQVVRLSLDADGLENHLGNHLSRLATETIDSNSGAERPTTDAPTNIPTDQPSAN